MQSFQKEEFGNKFFKQENLVKLQMKIKCLSLAAIIALTVIMGLNPDTAIAENSTTITPLTDEISLKKTVVPMDIPEDNTFPWGSVKGQASENAERYPVIIQIFKGEDPVHFAQVDVKGDGSFEYKFRVRNVDADTGVATNYFEGQYLVNIFRVIPNTDEII
jgi:hypothetical protein